MICLLFCYPQIDDLEVDPEYYPKANAWIDWGVMMNIGNLAIINMGSSCLLSHDPVARRYHGIGCLMLSSFILVPITTILDL